jgi:hypothetical protein
MAAAEDDAALERALTQKLYRKDCPTPEILGEIRLGLLPQAEVDATRDHLGICPHCRAEVEALDRLLRLVDRERPGLRRMLCRLAPTSMVAERPGFALRGNGRLTYATYEAGEFTVMLAIQEDPRDAKGRSVLGVLTSGYEAQTSGTATLAGEAGEFHTQIDEDGQFAFAGVAAGHYVLDIEVGSALVELEPLEIR